MWKKGKKRVCGLEIKIRSIEQAILDLFLHLEWELDLEIGSNQSFSFMWYSWSEELTLISNNWIWLAFFLEWDFIVQDNNLSMYKLAGHYAITRSSSRLKTQLIILTIWLIPFSFPYIVQVSCWKIFIFSALLKMLKG
jgi:hypothetical protein